jgi:CRISPR/Cas system CSM-associated protein Csm2 small subunit
MLNRLGSNTIISFFIYAIVHIALHWSLTNFNAKITSKEFETKKKTDTWKKIKMKLVRVAMHQSYSSNRVLINKSTLTLIIQWNNFVSKLMTNHVEKWFKNYHKFVSKIISIPNIHWQENCKCFVKEPTWKYQWIVLQKWCIINSVLINNSS